jgi:hypothetical protein
MSYEGQLVYDILAAWGAHPRLRIARINTGKAFPPGSKRLVTFGVPGTPDICGMVAPDGRFLGIECKSATDKQRKAQLAFERMVKAFGGIYILARSVDDVDQRLVALGVTR